MTSVSDQSPDTAHLCTLCILPCEEDNTLNRAKCATSVHANCLIKKDREKATKKVQGASPTWLHEVLFATGICYFCPTCLPALQFDHLATDNRPNSSTDLANKVAWIENKVDLLLSVLVDSAQPVHPQAQNGQDQNEQNKAKSSYASVAAAQALTSASARKILKDVVTEVIDTKDTKAIQTKSVVLLGVEEKNDDASCVNAILAAMNLTCTVEKTHRLRKLQTKDEKATVNATAQPGVKRAATRPLLVTFRSELEQASVIKNAKSLQHSDFSEVFVCKWLTKEQREVEKDLRIKCKRLSNHNKPLENGKQLFVVANGQLHSRDAEGRINHKNSSDVDSLINEIEAASKGSDWLFLHSCLFNARSLNNKLAELSYLLDVESPSIAFITETWFNANTSDNCTSAGKSTYNILRCDRSSAGGSVCIIVDESQCHVSSSTARTNFNYSIIQAHIIVAHRLINVVCCYLPPASCRLDYDVARHFIRWWHS